MASKKRLLFKHKNGSTQPVLSLKKDEKEADGVKRLLENYPNLEKIGYHLVDDGNVKRLHAGPSDDGCTLCNRLDSSTRLAGKPLPKKSQASKKKTKPKEESKGGKE
jgi:hypothetical protein